jgi:uncharacterized protein with von Willebrand factor type A (vWA) domain
MGKPLVYKPTEYQRHLWKYHKLTDAAAEAAESEGRKRYEAFGDFSDEIFHRMYAEKPEMLEEPAPGSDVFVKMHQLMGDIPELEDLRTRCIGNERWAGIGSSAVIDTLLTDVQAPEEKVDDLRGDDGVKEYLERLLAETEDEGKREELQKTLDEQMDPDNPDGFPARGERAQNAANMTDETEVRNAIRKAVKKASEQIDAEETLVDAFSFGMERHSGRKARMSAHKELAKIVGRSNRLKEIAKLAGRLRRIAMEQQRQKPRKGTDEVTGIELGKDIGKMIPAEALWSDDEVDAVFALKLHENGLAQFELSKTPKKEQGPIILLKDSSASMKSGDADVWAAAVSLAFLEIAYEQKRAFAVVHFGSSTLRQDTFTSWVNIDRERLLEAISFFAADGGTNFMGPLADGVKIIRDTGSFHEADIVMITDGVSAVTDEFMQVWNKSRAELGFSCYSILVGSYTNAETNERFSDEVVHLAQVLRDDTEMHKFFKAV